MRAIIILIIMAAIIIIVVDSQAFGYARHNTQKKLVGSEKR